MVPPILCGFSQSVEPSPADGPVARVVAPLGPPDPGSRRARRLLAAPGLAAVGRTGGVRGGGRRHQALAVDLGPPGPATLEVAMEITVKLDEAVVAEAT